MSLKNLPKIDKITSLPEFSGCNPKLITKIAREKIENARNALISGALKEFDEVLLIDEIKRAYDDVFKPSLVPLINATGVILHTNMGRSLISKMLLQRASGIICNYSNLEYDLEKGCRGERYSHVNRHFQELLGVEDVLIVNNNAAAVFLILNTFAKKKEVVVSRGELVEIGGSFRIPEVMRQSGAILKEVGATNKTKIADYKEAIGEKTAMLMKVHQSNFSIEGFTQSVEYEDIKALSLEHNLIDYYDLGSGYVPTLPYNLGAKEHSLGEILKCNPSLISFSGDKLFGSVQAGIIAGKKELIAKLKKNQLLRMLRVDKITLALLEESIKSYLKEEYAQIPTLWMLFQSEDELLKRASKMCELLGENAQIVKSTTYMGGGTLPNKSFVTVALQIKGKATLLERKFRANGVIGRIENDKFLLDFRSILPSVEDELLKVVKTVLESK